MTPVRIQRKRTKGWRMPENTIYVGRGSKWGNPYKVEECTSRESAVYAFRILMESEPENAQMIRSELAGKNLSCWCRLDQDCHADVLLDIANGGGK